MGSCSAPRGLIALFIALSGSGAAAAACSDASIELKNSDAVARFNIEIADTAEERAVGLMNRDHLATSAGMLFVYDAPQHVSFWMKNTRIPLDMIFVDSTGRVKSVYPMAKPMDLTPIDGGTDIVFVLEINGGLAERLGIGAGSVLRHPAIDPAIAVWACSSD